MGTQPTPMPLAPTRAEGYRRAVGKEQGGIELAQRFFHEVLGVETFPITDPEQNYHYGDLWLPTNATVEVKRQPIDPGRYQMNFVELFELTTNPRHHGGFEDFCQLLGIDPHDAARWTVTDHRDRSRQPLGRPDRLSVSIRSLTTSRYTLYANPDATHPIVYLYDSPALAAHCIHLAGRDGVHRAMGRSNQDTVAVLVPNAAKRWQLDGTRWEWVGVGNEHTALTLLADQCTTQRPPG